ELERDLPLPAGLERRNVHDYTAVLHEHSRFEREIAGFGYGQAVDVVLSAQRLDGSHFVIPPNMIRSPRFAAKCSKNLGETAEDSPVAIEHARSAADRARLIERVTYRISCDFVANFDPARYLGLSGSPAPIVARPSGRAQRALAQPLQRVLVS